MESNQPTLRVPHNIGIGGNFITTTKENAQKIADKYVQLMSDERIRQVEVEGWSPEHDDTHNDGSLADAAACYAATSLFIFEPVAIGEADARITDVWPFEPECFKKEQKSREQQLITAGALIIAELERLDREKIKQTLNLCDDCALHCSTCGASPKFGTAIGNDNVYECDTFQQKPYQMQCPYGYDMAGHSDE